MPSPDSLKIKLFTPIPSAPELDLDGKMLTKDATTKDCLFTMTEYLSENVLQSIPKEFRIKQFFDKGLFKSFRKQNPHNIPVKKEKTLKNPEPVKEGEAKNPEPVKEGEAKNPEPVKEGEAKNPEPVKEKETPNQDTKVGGKENSSNKENTVSNGELVGTYRKIINHNIRLTLNTLFQKNNKIVIKGNTYTIGYYNWTDYDWDIDAKRPTFDKKQYVTSQFVKEQLKKIPPVLKHGLTNDKLNADNDFFGAAGFDNEEDAVNAKEVIHAKEVTNAKEVLNQGRTNQASIDLTDDNDYVEKVEKARKTLGLVKGQTNPGDQINDIFIKPDPDAIPETLPNLTGTVAVVPPNSTVAVVPPNSTAAVMPPNSTVAVVPPNSTTEVNNQSGGLTSENKSSTQEDSFNDSRHRSSFDPKHHFSSLDPRFPYNPHYDPRYRSHSKMVDIDESNFAIYISVEIYLVKGESLSPEDESNLNCKNKWNQVLVPFDQLIGREKRGVLPDYSLEQTSKPESSKSNGSKEPEEPTTKETTAKEPEGPTTKESNESEEPTSEESNAHGGGTRHRSKTHRQKKRKTVKKNKQKKRRATRKRRRPRGSRRR
jgi:hypothetical protein